MAPVVAVGPVHYRALLVLALLPALLAGGCKEQRKPVVVLAAASLARVMDEVEEDFEASHPRLDVQVEISGSQAACRKVAELGRQADLVLTADYRVIDRILRPQHARATVRFATGAVVLTHMEHSRHTEEITGKNWHEVLLRDGVRLGLVDPDLGPIGYRTLLVWELAGRKLKDLGLARKLRARVSKEHLTPHEAELMQLLQSRALDYAFVYRSTAEEHNLKSVELDPTINLGDAARAAQYAEAEVEVRMSSREAPRRIKGAPVVYGAAIPLAAQNPRGAGALLRHLLSDAGGRSLQRTGFTPLSPARCDGCGALPPAVQALVKPL